MEFEVALKKYKEAKELIKNYNYALFIMSYDCQTDCPKTGKKYSMDVQEFFETKMYEIILNPEYNESIITLNNNLDKLDDLMKKCIEHEFKNINKLSKIPHDELMKHMQNSSRCAMTWEKGHTTGDYSEFDPEIKELVDYYKKYTSWQDNPGKESYDVLLDEMEDDFNVEKYDAFFDLIRSEIVPLARKIIDLPKKYNPKLDDLTFDIAKQQELTELIIARMGYTKDVGCVRTTIHPFTSGAHANDVRITTSYDPKLLISNLYSVMHETGHALYELGQDPSLNGTACFGGTSCAMHESQSRFYENYLGRSKFFVKYLYPELVKMFPVQMEGISEDDIYYYVNSVSNQFKRTEADELTYSIHILIRYEVEKMLFRNEITTDEIEVTFANLFEKYFGVRPVGKLQGCYQDVHWSGSFGYFPTYALGNAFAAQFYRVMRNDIDVDTCLEKGEFAPITNWLKEHIHKYGSTKKNLEILKECTGEDFNPSYYIEYLKDKFTKIYNI